MTDNSRAKKILDIVAKRCGHKSVELLYAAGALKWHPYVRTQTNQHSLLYSQKEDQCKYIGIIGSSHSYAECLNTMLKETSNGYDIKIDSLNFEFGDNDEDVFLRRGMTEDMLLIEMDLDSLNG